MYLFWMARARREEESKQKNAREKRRRRRTAFSRQFSHYLWPPKKFFFFQDGLKVFCLLLIGIAEYRVYRTTVVEKHSKNLILKPFEFEFSRKKSTLES